VTAQPVPVPVASRGRTLVLVALAAVASAVATALVAFAALALGADSTFAPLQPQAYLTFAVAGTIAAIAGWVLVVRFVPRSTRLLRVLVPVLLAVSFIPDIALLLTGFIPGATATGVIGLMLMHPIVAAIATLTGRMIAPPR
jgi:hypothetical protein